MATRPLRKIFIVRLWHDQEGQWAWQGEVQFAETGETQRIHSAGELLDYIQERMAGTSDLSTLSSEGLR
ncbi:MAG: hypothetical protein H6662_06955 [Ardenticatenaceae bacterium]|nr:hypothetical protein [Anaerolineales bacterium]MCB8921305.1 hypothetical protein [Ardenticatenaceae bacterium]MCB8990671.1 hypothetical protein [Ardenticatenaceae bacterium]MCB9004070.1 hypothetical protein [Ardenticatenaceae bacterium]